MNNLKSNLRVLFVDDETRVLDGLRRQFRAKRAQWDMRFASSGPDALAMLKEQPCDVIISDMRMPQMNGAELLKQVQEHWPGTLRLVLSGQTEFSEMMDDIGAIHQFLQKPCEPEQLEVAVTRSSHLANLIERDDLRAITMSLRSLPVISSSYRELIDVLDNPDADASQISKVVERDIGLSVKLIQIVNSAFFGLPRRVKTAKEAVVLIGTRHLKYLSVTAKVFDALADGNASCKTVSALWRASADIGSLAARFARQNGASQDTIDAARLAGMLSLIGRGILVRSEPERFAAVVRSSSNNPCLLGEAERDAYGVPQEYVGAYALGLWAFGDEVIEAVARSRTPSQSGVTDKDHPLAFVHLARSEYEARPCVERIDRDDAWLAEVGVDQVDPGRTGNAA